MSYRSTARTHAGAVRPHNEDALLERTDIGVWAVSDGMGGHAAGDVASALVIEAIRGLPRPSPGMDFAKAVREALARVNDDLVARGASFSPDRTMGATVTVLAADETRFFCLWAGDSRLYRFHKGVLTQLTRDHRYIQALLDSGLLDEKEAEHHPQRSVITRAVGVAPDLKLDNCEGTVAPGDMFLLATDGVTGVCKDGEIAQILSRHDIEVAADHIVARCLEAGAPDNLSLILVQKSMA